ncbi:MAG: hypothetical protein DCC75_07150, partial [Proteobacteria bacterium]
MEPQTRYSLKDRILDHPDVAEAVNEDPLFRFLANYWRQLGVVIIAVAAGLYAKQQFDQTHDVRMSEAAALYQRVSEEFGDLKRKSTDLMEAQSKQAEAAKKLAAAAEKEKGALEADLNKAEEDLKKKQGDFEAVSKKLKESIAALSDSRPPYNEIAGTYSLLSQKITLGQVRPAQGANALEDLAGDGGGERLLAELQEFLSAKLMLDQPGTALEGRRRLVALAEKGEYVHAVSALAVARISKSAAETREAYQLLERVNQSHPEQAEIIKEDLER